jgi:hypothetical protein
LSAGFAMDSSEALDDDGDAGEAEHLKDGLVYSP